MPAITDTRSLPPIAVHWVRNNVLAAIISGVGSLLFYGLRDAIGAVDADVGLGVIVTVYALWIGLAVFVGAVNGVLSGAVLQRILPLLPARTWIALQVLIAVVIAIMTGMSLVGPPKAPAAPQDVPMLATLLGGLILGAIFGVAIGALEALVLRRAAFGTGAWITCSSIAYAVALAFFAASAKLLEVGSNFAGEFASQALYVVASVLAGLIMLPALRRLKTPLSTAPQYFT
jgi:hypothetical protein